MTQAETQRRDNRHWLETCPDCGGSGEYGGLDDWYCSTCKGEGLVWVSDEEDDDK